MTGVRLDLPPDALDAIAELLVERVIARLPEAGSEHRWLNTRQAAEYLGTTTNALHKLTSARSVPFSQDVAGGRCWFHTKDLDDWRRGQRGANT